MWRVVEGRGWVDSKVRCGGWTLLLQTPLRWPWESYFTSLGWNGLLFFKHEFCWSVTHIQKNTQVVKHSLNFLVVLACQRGIITVSLTQGRCEGLMTKHSCSTQPGARDTEGLHSASSPAVMGASLTGILPLTQRCSNLVSFFIPPDSIHLDVRGAKRILLPIRLVSREIHQQNWAPESHSCHPTCHSSLVEGFFSCLKCQASWEL